MRDQAEREESDDVLVNVQERDALEERMRADVLNREGQAFPTPGRIVLYQTDGRNGLDYVLPAIVTVTRTSHPGDYPDGKPNSLPVPTSDAHVHLTVFTPGGFGSQYVADGESSSYSQYTQDETPNLGRPDSFVPGSGTYTEWDVRHDPEGGRRSWRWPDRT